MRTRQLLGILAVGPAGALIAIASHRASDGTGVVQATPDEPWQAAPEPAPPLAPLKTSSTQPAAAPAIAPTAVASAPFDRVAACHEREILADADPQKPWAKAAMASAEALMITHREDAK
ncbi:MAG: hypothetical protein AMXMBFR83_05760 [Phycisphaerae bacterium]